jgi:ribosomal protein S14
MPEKTFKQVCKCENCGNEAEMQVTCTLDFGEDVVAPEKDSNSTETSSPRKKVQGQAVCSSCGNEADMWIEVE